MLLLISACAPPVDDATVSAELASVATVVHVRWEGKGDVEFGPTTAYGTTAPGRDGSATLVGNREDTEVHFRVVTGGWAGEDHVLRTGALPTEGFTLHEAGDLGSAFVLGSWMEGPSSNSGIFILDAEGQPVWAHTVEWGVVPAVHLSDGGLLYLNSSHEEVQDARVVRVSLDGETERVVPLPYAHHDVVEVPGIDFASIVGEVREIDGEPVVGDRIVEVLEDGTQREVWNAFDHFEVAIESVSAFTAYPMGADWTHANGLYWDPEDDAYYLSLYYLRCVVKVDRATGEQRWVFASPAGSTPGDFAVTDPFGPQHAPEWVDGELMFFDNAYGRDEGSRLVRYALDGATATRTWEWSHPDEVFVVVLGDVDARPDGGVLASWSGTGEIFAIDADDAIRWRVSSDREEAFLAQVEALEGLY